MTLTLSNVAGIYSVVSSAYLMTSLDGCKSERQILHSEGPNMVP